MKAKDLRIGNWVQYDGTFYQIESLTKVDAVVRREGTFDFGNRSIEKAQPIELTEELLVKIGFELVNTKRLAGYEMVKELENNVYEFFVFKIFDNNDTLLNIRKQKGGGFEYGEFTKRGIKYLHELQNAYYCLTNEELNIEL